jgi:signal peptidase I
MTDRARKYVIEIALTAGAVAGLLCVIAAILSVAFGLSPLIFRSDSMSPAIEVGDVAISRSASAADVSAGDIVSVSRPDGTRITHRVVSIDSVVGNSTTMTLRGDANNINDPEPYTVTSVDRVLFDIPNLGYMLSWFANPYAWAIATLLTLGLLGAAFRPGRIFHTPNRGLAITPPSTRSQHASIAVQTVIVVTVVATAVAGYARTHSTLAALTDSATATGTVSAGRPLAPTSLSCTDVVGGFPLANSANLSWPNPVDRQNYTYQLIFTPPFGGATRTDVRANTGTTPTTLAITRSYLTGLFGVFTTLDGSYTLELRSKVGNFVSTGKVGITLNSVFSTSVYCGSTPPQTVARIAPAETTTKSETVATTTPQAPARSTSSPSTPSASTAPPTSSTSTPPTEGPVTVATPSPLPNLAPDTTSPTGTYTASAKDNIVVIRDTTSGTEQFRVDISAAKLDWVDDNTLRATAADGTTTTVTRTDGQWIPSGATAPAAG